MTDPLFQTWLADHLFTPSELEDSLACPYRFYLSSYLKLEPEREWETEMTPREQGALLHRVLERFLREDREIVAVLEEETSSFQENHPQLSPFLFRLQKERMVATLRSFVEKYLRERSEERTLAPRYLEWSFGGKTPPFVIEDREGPIRIRGRIDRIDVDERRRRFLVIDYKTGSAKITGNRIFRGESFQLPLYILAVERLLLPGYEPMGALYYHLSDMSQKDGLLHADRLPPFLEIHPRSSSLIPAARWEAALQATKERVRAIVSEIRRENFPSRPEACERRCPYWDLCRIRIRIGGQVLTWDNLNDARPNVNHVKT